MKDGDDEKCNTNNQGFGERECFKSLKKGDWTKKAGVREGGSSLG